MDIYLHDEMEQRIFDELSKMTIIDAHEHLRPEAQYSKAPMDWAWLLQYVINDMVAAGFEGGRLLPLFRGPFAA